MRRPSHSILGVVLVAWGCSSTVAASHDAPTDASVDAPPSTDTPVEPRLDVPALQPDGAPVARADVIAWIHYENHAWGAQCRDTAIFADGRVGTSWDCGPALLSIEGPPRPSDALALRRDLLATGIFAVDPAGYRQGEDCCDRGGNVIILWRDGVPGAWTVNSSAPEPVQTTVRLLGEYLGIVIRP